MSKAKEMSGKWVRTRVVCRFCRGRGHTRFLKRTCRVCFGKGEI